MLEINGVKIHWLGHASFYLENDLKIYIDPYQISPKEKADLIFITHEHYDHLSPEDLEKIVKEETTIVAAKECENKLTSFNCEKIFVEPFEEIEVKGVKVKPIPAYNTNKPFHKKEDGKVGYVITVKDVSIYHAGDTDFIEEMKDLKPKVALLPVSGTYVMTAEEAAEAVKAIKPEIAVPMHYGSIVGSLEDAKRFEELASKHCKVVILEKE